MKQADLKDMFEKVFKNVCISAIAVFLDVLSPTAASSATKTTWGAEEDPVDLESVDKWYILVD